MATGYIHSRESFGTVDGPGVRYVLFMQGCPARCLYCHNPDTWDIHGGTSVTVEDVLSEYRKNRMFYRNGGITVSGGEPLLQLPFLCALFKAAREEGIHTCLDTAGVTFHRDPVYLSMLDDLMSHTDLVMLDIKHTDPEKHKMLTGMDNAAVLDFARYLTDKNITVWIRRVVVEGLTDDEEELLSLGRLIGEMPNVKALDVLPYHALGAQKYAGLGIPYPLAHLSPLPTEKAVAAKKTVLAGIREAKK
ncbi:MAG: pyruvate formate lyase-activating protein [Clostridia bacterium]|nr:pyruvate formate lyase-activating protein [Clostridia bacterium]